MKRFRGSVRVLRFGSMNPLSTTSRFVLFRTSFGPLPGFDDLAQGCLKIARQGTTGIYHLAGTEVMNGYDRARRFVTSYGLGVALL